MNGRNKGFTPLEKAVREPLGSLTGFTLLELQVASAIAFLIFAAVLSLYMFAWRSFAIGNTLLDVYSNSRIASERLTRDIRCAAQVVSSHDSYAADDEIIYTTTNSSIVLMVPSIDSHGEVISPNYDYIIYGLRDALQGKDLYRIVDKHTSSSRSPGSSVIAHNCANLSFSSGGVALLSITHLSTVNAISIYLPMNKSTMSGTYIASTNPTTIVKLRNK